MPDYHLVILKKPYLDAILSGRKKIESRFARAKPSALGRVHPGDKLFLKVSSGPILAIATARRVEHFSDLTPKQITAIKRRYNQDIGGSEQYWADKINCKFGFLVWLADVRPIEPLRIIKRDWRAWVVLTERENFGLLPTGKIEQPLNPRCRRILSERCNKTAH
jgi:hypothetical protein